MAAIETTGTFAAKQNPIVATFLAAFSAFTSWNDARATRSALSALSDRELEDIGLCRGDIEYVATKF